MAATTSPRRGNNFLVHDMTPHDPYNGSIINKPTSTSTSTTNTSSPSSYEPSGGAPLRDNRRKKINDAEESGNRHTNGIMHKPLDPPLETAPLGDGAGVLLGKKSTQHVRVGPGLDNRWKEVEEARSDRAKQVGKQTEFRSKGEHLDAIAAEHRAVCRERSMAAELNMLAAEEPWGKPAVGTAVRTKSGSIIAKRRNGVERGDHFQQSDGTSYVDTAFCKPGGGSPRKDADGHIIVTRPSDVEQQRHHTEGPADAYVAVSFGKAGPGGVPLKDDMGNVLARLPNIMGSNRHHLEGEGEAYNDVTFGRGTGNGPSLNAQGVADAKRTSQVAKHKQHTEGPPGYVDQVFGKPSNGAPIRSHDGSIQAHQTRYTEGPLYDGPADTYTGKVFGKGNPHKDDKGEIHAHLRNEMGLLEREAPLGYVDETFGKEGGGSPRRTDSGNPSGRYLGDLSKPDFDPENRKSVFRTPPSSNSTTPTTSPTKHQGKGANKGSLNGNGSSKSLDGSLGSSSGNSNSTNNSNSVKNWSRHATHASQSSSEEFTQTQTQAQPRRSKNSVRFDATQ